MPDKRPVAFLFPGQGAQHPRMAAGLYGRDPVFTTTLDTAFQLLGDVGQAVREDWLATTPSPAYDDVTRAQPLLYAIGYALAEMVADWGVEPAILLGHSVGEMVAATVARVLTFSDGMALMRDRLEQFAGTPPGGMLAVAASAAEIAPFTSEAVSLAAVNSGRQVLLAGERFHLDAAASRLRAAGFTCLPVSARQAFHSPVVADAAHRSRGAWQAVRLSPPATAIYSAYLEGILPVQVAADPEFWAMQPTRPVLFWPTLNRMLADHDLLLIETGPGQSLTALARRHPAVTSGRSSIVPLLPAASGEPEDDVDAVRTAARRVAAEGYALGELELT
jgi:acyl transferase domain-containing protein